MRSSLDLGGEGFQGPVPGQLLGTRQLSPEFLHPLVTPSRSSPSQYLGSNLGLLDLANKITRSVANNNIHLQGIAQMARLVNGHARGAGIPFYHAPPPQRTHPHTYSPSSWPLCSVGRPRFQWPPKPNPSPPTVTRPPCRPPHCPPSPQGKVTRPRHSRVPKEIKACESHNDDCSEETSRGAGRERGGKPKLRRW